MSRLCCCGQHEKPPALKDAPTPPPIAPVVLTETARLKLLLARWMDWGALPSARDIGALRADTRLALGLPPLPPEEP